MKLGLINSAWLGSPVGTAQGIHKTKEIGFDTIDIFADPLEIDIKERKLIKDSCHEVKLPIISVCCCALGIADFNRAVRRFHVERAKEYLDFVYELEGPESFAGAGRIHLATGSHRAWRSMEMGGGSGGGVGRLRRGIGH